MLRVVVACECNGWVRDAFRDLGHDAWSVDLKPDVDGSPYHIQGDALDVLYDHRQRWDLMIGHPVCKYLANSGVRWLYTQRGRWQLMEKGAAFFRAIYDAPIPLKCIENPIIHCHALQEIDRGPATQVIQPWMFGHKACKATCLWLVGLPKLIPTQIVGPPPKIMSQEERRVWHAIHLMPPSEDREAKRSITFSGVACAMAEQWGLVYDGSTQQHRLRTAGEHCCST